MRDDLVEAIVKQGLSVATLGTPAQVQMQIAHNVARAAIAVVIEQCAKVAEEKYEDAGWHGNYQSAGKNIAAAIRNLGESE